MFDFDWWWLVDSDYPSPAEGGMIGVGVLMVLGALVLYVFLQGRPVSPDATMR